MRSMSQKSKGSRHSSGERQLSQFERNIDIASDKHTPFGIPAHIKKEIKLFKRQQIDDEMQRSTEEFHSYIHMDGSSKNKSVKWTRQDQSDQDGNQVTAVTIEEGLYSPSEKVKDEHFNVDSTYRRQRNAVHFSTLDHY